MDLLPFFAYVVRLISFHYAKKRKRTYTCNNEYYWKYGNNFQKIYDLEYTFEKRLMFTIIIFW